jgi:seryl-tRNA synthetase
MIDLRLLRDDPERFRVSQRARGEPVELVDEILDADARHRDAIARFEELRAEHKALGREVARAPDDDSPAGRPALLARGRNLAARVREAEEQRAAAAAELDRRHRALPNLVEGAPAGGAEDFIVLDTVGAPPEYGFPVRDHVDLGTGLGALDVERGAKVSGARFYFLTGVGALLEFALVRLAVRQAVDTGFTPVIAPALVKPEAMEGTGFLGAHAAEVYRLATDDLYLVGTSEVPLAAYHMDETLPAGTLPRYYAGFSPCFRREAGSYGRDTRGIIRVHWFDKVEMFVFCRAADAAAEHERLLGFERQFLGMLHLPFRVIDVAAGDLGDSAARKFDCEAWLPSQERWLELTSTSNCTTFQARRLGVRTPAEQAGGSATEPVATLNGTLCAVARTIATLLEVHQQADGSVRLPPALAAELGTEVLAPPAQGREP